jgi:hypothetical protein
MRKLLVVLLLWALLPAIPASAEAPAAQGWWSALNLAGLPALPAPPDVTDGDLLVQGGDLVDELPLALRDPNRQPAPLAVTALRFVVDPASTVTSLDLVVKGPAVANDVRAFSAAEAWKPASNGPAAEAPDVGLADVSQGLLSGDGKTLSFPDISRLVRPGGVLDVVLIAGIADRVVIAKPTAAALSVTDDDSLPELPPLPEAPLPGPPSTAPLPPATSGPFTPLPGSGTPQLPPAPTVVGPAPTAARPVVRAAHADDARTRVLALLEAVLVAVFFGLLGSGPLGRLGRFTGFAATRRGTEVERGVGRFRSVRTGPTPRL